MDGLKTVFTTKRNRITPQKTPMSSGNLKKIKNFLSKNILQQHLRLNTNTRPRKNLGFIAATKMYCEERMETEETTCKSLGKRTDYKIKKKYSKIILQQRKPLARTAERKKNKRRKRKK